MIDTPGHVDFTYEVSRSLAACEGTVLLVDAAQGIEAQTLANLYLAMENDLKIIPVLNKIDLPAAQPEKFSEELANLIGCQPEDVLKVSAKTGIGVDALLDRVVRDVPAPVGVADAPARAMIFDSVYDSYRGVVTYVRVIDGQLNKRERIRMMSTGATHELLEIGVSSPEMTPADGIGVGEVGYIITGVKDVRQSKVGDTITSCRTRARPRRSAGTRTPSRWSSRACIRWTGPTTPSCARPSTSSSSTTPPWSTSRRPPRPSASASASASSACCTSTSSGSGWSASSTSTSSPPRPTWSTA
jgi:elongation factor 4